MVDLNLMPTPLIQRSEVVPGGESAAYGSDAVAGVVNLILDMELTGLRMSAQFGQTDAGDGDEYLLSLAAGLHFGDGRGRVIAGVEYVAKLGTASCYSRDRSARSCNTVSNPFVAGSTPALPPFSLTPIVHALQSRGGGCRGSQLADATSINLPDPVERHHPDIRKGET